MSKFWLKVGCTVAGLLAVIGVSSIYNKNAQDFMSAAYIPKDSGRIVSLTEPELRLLEELRESGRLNATRALRINTKDLAESATDEAVRLQKLEGGHNRTTNALDLANERARLQELLKQAETLRLMGFEANKLELMRQRISNVEAALAAAQTTAATPAVGAFATTSNPQWANLDALTPGTLGTSVKDKVRQGTWFEVHLRVGSESPKEMKTQLLTEYPDNKAVNARENVLMAPRMEARLSGEGFNIPEKGWQLQVVSKKSGAEWHWLVQAEDSGSLELVAELQGILEVEGKPTPKRFPAVRQTINVEVHPAYLLTGFISRNWQYIITAIAPAIGVFWTFLWRPRKSDGNLGLTAFERFRVRREKRSGSRG